MTNEDAIAADSMIAPWSLSADLRFITPEGKETDVRLRKSGDAYQAILTHNGTKLWSGPNPKLFIQHFWRYDFEGDRK